MEIRQPGPLGAEGRKSTHDFLSLYSPVQDSRPSQGDFSVKVGGGSGKSGMPNTPRSKHSATEQRRRSKINDRFQILRELIPPTDQKRDKASFLLEAIEYIQYLQEKVDKYESSYQGWNQELPKLMPWQNIHCSTEGFVDQSRALNSGSGPKLMFAAKFDENNIVISPTNTRNGQKNEVESDMSTVTTLKEIDHHSGLTNKAVPVPLSLKPNIFTPRESCSLMIPSGMENLTSQPQSPFLQGRPHTTDCVVASNKLKEHELAIESGKISISSVYSQGLLNTLTQALQNSGIDLSQTSISVQIDLGNSRLPASTSTVKDSAGALSRDASSVEESDQALKRLKKG